MSAVVSNRIAPAAVSAKYSPDDLLCMRDLNGAILLINEAWEGVLGYTPGELETLPLLELVHPDDREKTRETMDRVNALETASQFRNRYRAKDGTYRTLEWNASRNGDLIVGVAREITGAATAA